MLAGTGVLVAAATFGLTGCGGHGSTHHSSGTHGPRSALAGLSGPEIASRGLRTTKSVSSLTVDLDGTVGGKHLRYHMSSDNRDSCAGSVALGTGQGTVRIIKVGDTVYMKYDDAYYRAQGKDGAKVRRVLGDRWLRMSASSSDAKDFTLACDSDKLLAQFPTGPNDAVKGRPTTAYGQPVVPVSDRAGREKDTLYVASRGKPYVLKAVSAGGKEPATIRLSGFDRPVGAKAPARSVDLNSLTG